MVYILTNLKVLLITIVAVIILSLSYIGLGYILRSPEMLELTFDEYKIPFSSLGRNLYAKLYWDETLSFSEDSVRKRYDYVDFFHGNTWHEYAANKGNMNAQFYLAKEISVYPYNYQGALNNGHDYNKDASYKLYWLSKAADQGHNEALDSLGVLYERGAVSFPPDTMAALKYYKIASDKGDLFAITRRGGLMVALNDTTGLALLRKADSQGYIPASIELGKFYYPSGTTPNKYSNRDLSIFYFNKASKDDKSGVADYYRGWLNSNRLYYDTDTETMELFLSSAKKGYTPAKYMLGYLTVILNSVNIGAHRLSTPPYQYRIDSFDKFCKKDRENKIECKTYYSSIKKVGYHTYCGWAWLIIAAEDGHKDALYYIEEHKDNQILRDVLSCRHSRIESTIYGTIQSNVESTDGSK